MTTSITEQLGAYFAQAGGDVVAAYLFGSEARGTAAAHSDVDVAILRGSRPAPTLLAQPYALADELGGLLGRRVDVVVLDSAPPDLVHRVLRDGILVHERDRAARVRFEVAARNAYFDLKPFLDRYRRQVA